MRRLLLHVLIGIAVFSALCLSLPGVAQEKAEPQGGTVTGILTAKGESWIEVKADGAQAAERYLPFWRGGAPADGGGYDKEMLKTIKTLVVPNRVKLEWTQQEHKRIVSVEMQQPKEKSGTLVGKVTACGKGGNDVWVEIQPQIDGKPDPAQPVERYVPRWTGGALDKAMIATMGTLKLGMLVEVKWLYDERKRAVTITTLENPGNTAPV